MSLGRKFVVGLVVVGVLLSAFPFYATVVPGIQEPRSSRMLGAYPLEEPIEDTQFYEWDVVQYGALSERNQRTVDRIIDPPSDATTYQINDPPHGPVSATLPPRGSPIIDRAPMVVRKDGTLYAIEKYGWSDMPNLERMVVVRGIQVVGILTLLVTAILFWSDRGHRR